MDRRIRMGADVWWGAALAALVMAGGASAQEIRFEDQAGRLVVMDKPAEHIVAIPIPSPPVAAATLGRVDSIVAMHPRAMNSARIGMIDELFPELLDIPTDIIVGSGFDPNVEEILKYDPDVVFQWASQDLGVLEAAGLTAVALETGSHDRLERLMEIFGIVHGEEKRAADIAQWHRDTIAEIAATAKGIPDDDRPGILYFYRYHLGDGWLTRGGDTTTGYRTWYQDLVGARNVAAGGANEIAFTAEQALAWDPDIILLNAYERADVTGADLTPADVYADPILSQTRAAQAKRVYKMPVGAVWWDSGNQESPLMWKWIAILSHPDVYDYDLREEIRQAFDSMDGYALSEAEIDGILHMDMHEVAANYERFAAGAQASR